MMHNYTWGLMDYSLLYCLFFYNLAFKYFAVDKVKAVCLFSSNFGHAMQTFKKFKQSIKRYYCAKPNQTILRSRQKTG